MHNKLYLNFTRKGKPLKVKLQPNEPKPSVKGGAIEAIKPIVRIPTNINPKNNIKFQIL